MSETPLNIDRLRQACQYHGARMEAIESLGPLEALDPGVPA